MKEAIHFDLDGAWTDSPLPRIEAEEWGPQLRFSAPPREVERFYSEIQSQLRDFILFGSGDFHHLSGLWLRRVQRPVTLVSFDNHPDWDVRPPRWCCGGWINRALELPQVRHVSIWGCGNFECWWPRQFFGNRKAERAGRLAVHPWADDRSAKEKQRRGAILRSNWREHFSDFARQLNGGEVYVTIDLDCLASEFAVTNWENGKFTLDDLLWALAELREHASIVAGDLCGAYSRPSYARRKQRFASETDHPKLELPAPEKIRATNLKAFQTLWPALVNGAL